MLTCSVFICCGWKQGGQFVKAVKVSKPHLWTYSLFELGLILGRDHDGRTGLLALLLVGFKFQLQLVDL